MPRIKSNKTPLISFPLFFDPDLITLCKPIFSAVQIAIGMKLK